MKTVLPRFVNGFSVEAAVSSATGMAATMGKHGKMYRSRRTGPPWAAQKIWFVIPST
ncbi:MAG: hypothetical protein V3571_13095 [Pseudodesulfovibrio sp.]